MFVLVCWALLQSAFGKLAATPSIVLHTCQVNKCNNHKRLCQSVYVSFEFENSHILSVYLDILFYNVNKLLYDVSLWMTNKLVFDLSCIVISIIFFI